MFTGPKAPEGYELNGVIDFLNETLRPQSTWSIAEEYPQALNTQNIHNMRIIKDENKVVAHAVMKPVIVKSPHVIFKVGTIGSVITNESYRNQGHSSTILKECLSAATEQMCDLALLWTNIYDFYQKLGFELAGNEVSMVFDQNFQFDSQKNLRFSTEKNVAPEALLRLYSQHTVNSVRTAEDVRKFLCIPNTQLYTAWSPSNQLLAYAVEGKGADLNGYLHEWGGAVSDLTSLLSFIRKTKGTPITLITPRHSQNLIQKLRPFAQVYNEGFLGMMKILNFEQLSAKIKRAFRSEGFSQIVLERQPDHFILGYGTDLYTISSEADLIRIMFGPLDVMQLTNFNEHTRQVLSQIFPLPLWIWGWDSI